MCDEKKPRLRGPKFEAEEKDLLIDLAIKNKSIVESKLTNKITKQLKDVWGDAKCHQLARLREQESKRVQNQVVEYASTSKAPES